MKDGKPTGGFDRLKIKFKKLEKKLEESQQDYQEKVDECADALRKQYLAEESEAQEKECRKWLYDHCPFWVRWKYNRKFKKGGAE